MPDTNSSTRLTLSLPDDHSLLLTGLSETDDFSSKTEAFTHILSEFYTDEESLYALKSAYSAGGLSLTRAYELLENPHTRTELREANVSLRIGPQSEDDLMTEILAAKSLGVSEGISEDVSGISDTIKHAQEDDNE